MINLIEFVVNALSAQSKKSKADRFKNEISDVKEEKHN
jgi:hypothetical protein